MRQRDQGIRLESLLEAISGFLDNQQDVIESVRRDLVRGLKQPDSGRHGLTATQVLRSLVLMRIKNWNYRELRERIADGCTLRQFTDFYCLPVPRHDAFHRGFNRLTPETLKAISSTSNLGSINTLTAAAGIASLRDSKHIEEERAENARVRDFTLEAFKSMGYEGADCHTNCIFVNLKRPAKEFRDACAALKVSVGRDFPPFEKTHSRISLGTMEEMKQAVQVFRKVLTSSSTSAGAR